MKISNNPEFLIEAAKILQAAAEEEIEARRKIIKIFAEQRKKG